MVLHETTRKLRVELRRTWLIWSCVPLIAVLIGLAATTALAASQPVLSQKRAEDSFYAFLAISALVFLFAFSVDGHWTNPKQVAEHIRKRLAGTQPDPGAAAQAAPQGPAEMRAAVAADIILGSSSSLGLMGHAIGVIAILCLISGAGPVHAYLLLAVAVSYQLYLFSRHPYYEQVAQAAYADELEPEEDDKQKQKGNRRK
ncbi:MAG: hypothetical protein FJX75_03895 [Armatimonadetes bacterium]|nr:hypothetical protein [Armatimonadota bacterium]